MSKKPEGITQERRVRRRNTVADVDMRNMMRELEWDRSGRCLICLGKLVPGRNICPYGGRGQEESE